MGRSAWVKRSLDLTLAVGGLIIAFLPMGVVALVVMLTMGRPILFTQLRSGLHGEPFRLYKFRTMSNARDGSGALLPDAQRLTRVGRLLRSTSIDELPALFNVLRGDMSLVGPRPLLAEYLPRYSPEAARRHDVRPGITGLAQVEGRNALTWERKFELDVWYVQNWSVGLDLKILARTFGQVFRRKGVTQPGHATAEEFKGD